MPLPQPLRQSLAIRIRTRTRRRDKSSLHDGTWPHTAMGAVTAVQRSTHSLASVMLFCALDAVGYFFKLRHRGCVAYALISPADNYEAILPIATGGAWCGDCPRGRPASDICDVVRIGHLPRIRTAPCDTDDTGSRADDVA